MIRTQPLTLFGIGLLAAISIGITNAAYLSVVIPEFRNESFYCALASSCIAEFVLFGYLAYALMATSSPEMPESAIRNRMLVLIFGWAAVVLVTSGIAAAPDNADTLFSDRIVLIQLTVSFLFCAAVFFQHRQASAVQIHDASTEPQRRQFDSYAGGLNDLLEDIRILIGQKAAHAVALDSLARRIDTLKQQLNAASGSQLRESEGASKCADDIALIEQRLIAVHDDAAILRSVDDGDFADQIEKTRSATDLALAVLREREDALVL